MIAHCERSADRFAILDRGMGGHHRTFDPSTIMPLAQRPEFGARHGLALTSRGLRFQSALQRPVPFRRPAISPASTPITTHIRGVFKAPANEPHRLGSRPAVTLTDDEQGPLNEHGQSM